MKYKNLTLPEVVTKQEQYGKNTLPEEKTVPAIRIFFLQFVNPLIYILGFIGVISFFLQKYTDIILISSVVLVNAFMGFFQENKTQNTLTALKKLVKPNAKVLRNNERREIEAAELVPGDIVFLAIGDRVPADGQVLEAMSFFTNEAILTGESEALEKKDGDEVFMGTIVSSGRAVIRIEKTGKNTKIGKIAATLKETEQPATTLQLRLKKLTRTLILVAIILAAAVFLLGLAIGRDSLEMLELSAVLLTAIIPEALLIVITLVLVIAMRESLKKKALIRKILAVETLGSVTVICTDKTGTLTEGKMKVVETDFVNKKNSYLTLCVCNDLSDTLEIALWDYLREQKDFDQEKIFDENIRIYEIPFGSEHKFMATVNSIFKDGEEYLASIKGAPEVIMGMTTISEDEKNNLMVKIDKWAEKGLKVLALAHKQITKNELPGIKDKKITGFEWDGLVGLWDPPRKDVKEALLAAKESGLKIKVVTGDYYRTAVKVMKFLGIKVKPDEIMEGAELEKLSAEDLKSRISDILLFSRTTPEQKLRIVGTLQELGEIVAMTGDGVNDAPALKKSNIGIVVGDASEVAKETADLILLDSNFKTIVSAVESGRLVFENIQKIILFILSNSFSEVVVIVGALIFNWPFPLTIIQILWLQLICDGPEDFILGFEPKEKETMLDGPKRLADPIFGKSSLLTTIAISLVSGLISLSFFWYFGLRGDNLVLGQTMAFMSLAFTSVSYIFSCRTLRKPFWKYENFWSNKGIFAVVAGSLFLAIIITYLPLTQRLLGLTPLNIYHWGLLFANAIILISVVEIAKYLIKVKNKKK
jgi:Ca2+-transporting ATPase